MSHRLVVGGRLSVAGNVHAFNIAQWDPVSATWSAFGLNVAGRVRALLALPNGDLVIGGDFTVAGSVVANGIARWNGSSWSALGAGANDRVDALALLPNGDIVAGGRFDIAGGVVTNGVARWDGVAWSAMGAGIPGLASNQLLGVDCLATLPNGDVVAGGRFPAMDNVVVRNIARWNGTTWSPMGAGIGLAANGRTDSIAVQPNGDVVASGEDPGTHSVKSWNGFAWIPFGSGMDQLVEQMITLPNGDILACGQFPAAGGTPADKLARWDGTAWSPVNTGLANGSVLLAVAALPSGDYFVGGIFDEIAGIGANSVARRRGAAWEAMGSGTNGAVYAFATRANGDVLAGGRFQTIAGTTASRVAAWNGAAWSAVGTPPMAVVSCVTELPGGDIVVGGNLQAGGWGLARWNGVSWSSFSSGMDNLPRALAVTSNGDLVVGGLFDQSNGQFANGLLRWNGLSWLPIGNANLTSGPTPLAGVRTVTELPNGDLIAGGQFTAAMGAVADNIARWDGTSWSSLGTGMNADVESLIVLPNGDLIAGGSFTVAGGVAADHVARWDGTAWSAMGSGVGGFVHTLTTLPAGDVVAGGSLPGEGILRWDGTSWASMDNGVVGTALALQMTRSGLFVGGSFTASGGGVSAFFAELEPTCPATAIPSGGCPSSGGANALQAATPPWAGTTLRLRATGLPQLAAVVAVFSLTGASLPLAQVFPEAPAGCDLLVNPDVVRLMLGVGGAVGFDIALPNTNAIAGVVVHHQMVVAELDPQLAFVEVTTTNKLELTFGAF